jgi:16S rRNA (guanine1207-N2)-methyltransferase
VVDGTVFAGDALQAVTNSDRVKSTIRVTPGVWQTDMSDHYFSENPAVERSPRQVRVTLPDLDFELTADAGVFASGGLDRGTKVLLKRNDQPTSEGDLLDVGCGYGPIAITLARRFPDRTIWAVDVNERALQLTRDNARGLENVNVCLPDDVPDDVLFGGIYSNPPIRIGNEALHALLLRWLPRLAPGASAFLVVHKHLGSDSLAKWMGVQGFGAQRLGSSGGFRVLRVCAG